LQIDADFAEREANEARVRAEGMMKQREHEALKKCRWSLEFDIRFLSFWLGGWRMSNPPD